MSVFLSLNDAFTVKRLEEGRINRRMRSRQSSTSSSKSHTKTRAVISQRPANAVPEPMIKERASSDTPYWLNQSSNVLPPRRARTLDDTQDSAEINFTTTKEFDIRRHRLPSETKLEFTVTQKRTREWHAKMKKMLDHFKHHHLNTWITLMPFKSRHGDLLFSPANISMLRYSWFEGVRTDWERVHKLVHFRHHDGMPVLASMRRITGLTSDVALTVEELVAAGLPIERSGLISGLPSLLEPKDTEDFSLREAVGDPSTSIRAIFALPKYWNDVYQDLKFDALQVNSLGNYFELLPPVEVVRMQLTELLDYFFTHLCTLKCKLDSVTNTTELQALLLYFFVYIPDFGHEWFKLMGLVWLPGFREHWNYDQRMRDRDSSTAPAQGNATQSRSSLTSDTFDRAQAHKSTVKGSVLVREFLLNKLHQAMAANVRYIVMPENRRKSNVRSQRYHKEEEVCDLWGAMIKFMVVDLLAVYTKTVMPEPSATVDVKPNPQATLSSRTTFLKVPVTNDASSGTISPRDLTAPVKLPTNDKFVNRGRHNSQEQYSTSLMMKRGIIPEAPPPEMCGARSFQGDLNTQEAVPSPVC